MNKAGSSKLLHCNLELLRKHHSSSTLLLPPCFSSLDGAALSTHKTSSLGVFLTHRQKVSKGATTNKSENEIVEAEEHVYLEEPNAAVAKGMQKSMTA